MITWTLAFKATFVLWHEADCFLRLPILSHRILRMLKDVDSGIDLFLNKVNTAV